MALMDGNPTEPRQISITDAAGDVLGFAAAELAGYLATLLGRGPIPVRKVAGLPASSLVLGSAAPPLAPLERCEPDAYEIAPAGAGAFFSGGSERAVLHAVYDFLAGLGCRWSLEGRGAEHVPSLGRLPSLQPKRLQPRFRIRGYASDIMTWHYQQPEHLAWRASEDRVFIDWMAKTGGNSLFLIRHPFDTQLSIAHLPAECRPRGIELEYGGHVIPLLLPREEFRQHPDYFPILAEGRRSDFGNICASSRPALALAARQAVLAVGEHPETAAIHIWGADLWGGGWCRCASCVSSTPQDQSLTVCNQVARGLADAGCPRPVFYLAYHDTLEPDLSVQPDGRVLAEFAPRERCYGHALNDPHCRTNARYRTALERYCDLFDGRVRLFEYYGDAILFCGCCVPLSQVIEADLEYAQQLGIREITMLQFGAFSQWAYGINHVAFAAATRAPSAGAMALYCSHFGELGGLAGEILARIERAMGRVVTYGDIRRPPRDPARAVALSRELNGAAVDLEGIRAEMAGISDRRLQDLEALVGYTAKVLAGVARETAQPGPGVREHAETLYSEAAQLMNDVSPQVRGIWGSLDLPLIQAMHSAGAFA